MIFWRRYFAELVGTAALLCAVIGSGIMAEQLAGGNTAYARLQFEDVDEVERRMIREALLRYCELDTLAMVMIVQGWREAVGEMGSVKQFGSEQH
jgi:hypothetical protein